MSYIALNAVYVMELCERYIEKRTKQFLDSQESSIQKTMKGGWFSKPKTREEAIKYLQLNASLYSNWHLVKLSMIGDDLRVEDVLKACTLNPNGVIHLDVRDAAILSVVANST